MSGGSILKRRLKFNQSFADLHHKILSETIRIARL